MAKKKAAHKPERQDEGAMWKTYEKIYKQLGFTSTPDKFSESSWGGLLPGHLIGELTQLFPRREQRVE